MNGRRRAAVRAPPGASCRSRPAAPLTVGADVHRRLHYAGNPTPDAQSVGRGRLGGTRPTVCSSPASPTARPPGSRATTTPSDKATLPDHGHHRLAVPGRGQRHAWLDARGARQPDHVGLRPGRADGDLPGDACRSASTTWSTSAETPVPTRAALPPRLRHASSTTDFGRQPRDDGASSRSCSGRIRSAATRSSSPTTTSRSRSRRRACRSSAPTISTADGARSGWSRTSSRISGSATA